MATNLQPTPEEIEGFRAEAATMRAANVLPSEEPSRFNLLAGRDAELEGNTPFGRQVADHQPLFDAGGMAPLFSGEHYPRVTPYDRDSALIEASYLNEPFSYERRAKENSLGRGAHTTEGSKLVGNELLKGFHDLQKEGMVDKSIPLLSTDQFNTLPPEEKLNYLEGIVALSDMREAHVRMHIALDVARRYGTDLPADVVMDAEDRLTFEQKEAFAEQMMEGARQDARQEADKLVAQLGWDSIAGGTADAAIQEFIPVANVVTKMMFQGAMMDILGIPEEDRPVNLGDRRQLMRDWIVQEGPAKLRQDLIAIREMVEEKQKDPVEGWIYRDYLILEQLEAVFTPELFADDNPENKLDLWVGRFETAAEVIASGYILGRLSKAGRTLGQVFGATNRIMAGRAAAVSGARQAQTAIDTAVQGKLAEDLGVRPGEAALNLMPRPSPLVDERTVKLPGVADTVRRSETIREELQELHRGNLSKVFSSKEKQRIAKSEIDKLELGSNARAAPAMSAIEELQDGVRIRAVISKNGEEAYKDIEEAAIEVTQIDPMMENISIIRRGENGKLEPVTLTGPEELIRIATNSPENLSDAALASKMQDANEAGREMEFLLLEREAAKRSGEPTVSGVLNDEYFIEYDHFRAYHPTDKIAFGADTIRHTSSPLIANSPAFKFGDELSGSVMGVTLDEARANRLFNDLYKPYYKLNSASKSRVSRVFEWGEDFAKETDKDPDLFEILAEFPDLTPKEINGIVSVRMGLDAQLDITNRRIWREYNGLGYKTARSVDGTGEEYHGTVLAQDQVRGSVFYDPATKEMVTLSKGDKDFLYSRGGNVMKVPDDLAIEIAGTNGMKRVTQVILDPDYYKAGRLSETPLPRYPGYRYRFYEDPYLVVKRQRGVEVDGQVKAATEVDETAIYTAGSRLGGEAFLNRAFSKATDMATKKSVWLDKNGIEYDIVPARELDQTDSALKQRQALRTAGRMFLDQRNREALLSTDGNLSEVLDFTRALERGTSLSTRVNTHEDLLRTLREALIGSYRLPELQSSKVRTQDINEVISNLRTGRNNAVGDAGLVRTYNEAIDVAKYVRQIEGVDATGIPRMRAEVMRSAVWADRLLNSKGFKPGKFSSVEKYAQILDPLRAMRSVSFGVFMVLRAARQLALQASQPLFLAGIDPAYVLSGRGLVDTINLRSGLGSLRRADYVSDGMSVSQRAKMMGLTKREYKTLVTKLDKSGVVDVVDVHSFSGGTRRWNQLQPHDESLKGKAAYYTKKTGSVIYNGLKTYGFDLGEEINKVATFNIAWRRVMKEKGYKSLLDLTNDDWAKVSLDTERLSFAMNKAGAFQYQQGWLSVTTQFMSFTHKAGLTLAFQNPALSNKETAKIWAGLFAMYGANMFGMRDLTRESMYSIGLDDTTLEQKIPGFEGTVIDLLSAGLIQTMVNKVGNVTADDWKDLDTAAIGPVVNAKQFAEMFYEGIAERPIGTMFGPFGNRFSAFMEAAEFVNLMSVGHDGSPMERALFMADMAAKELLPQYNDATLAYLHWKHGISVSNSGIPYQLEPTLTSVFARGTVGMRTLEEQAVWRMNELTYANDSVVRDLIESGRRTVLKYTNLYRTNEVDADLMHDVARMVGEIAKLAPEGRQEEVIQGIMLKNFGTDDPEEAPAYKLGEAVIEKMSLTPGQAKSLMQHIAMPPETRQVVEDWIDESYDLRPMNQEQMVEEMIQSNPNVE